MRDKADSFSNAWAFFALRPAGVVIMLWGPSVVARASDVGEVLCACKSLISVGMTAQSC